MICSAVSLQKPIAILFDWDNTLVDTWSILHIATNKVLVKYGLPERTFEQIKNNAYQSLRDSFPIIFGSHWQDASSFFYETIHELSSDQLRSLPGSFELLEKIHAAGIPMGVVSNKLGAFLRQEVTHFHWDYLFQTVIGSKDAARDKPNPEPIELALRNIGQNSGPNIWYIGDMEGDWECSKLANCQPIAVHRIPEDPAIPFFENNDALRMFITEKFKS